MTLSLWKDLWSEQLPEITCTDEDLVLQIEAFWENLLFCTKPNMYPSERAETQLLSSIVFIAKYLDGLSKS
jgi:hypothetical protein